MLALLLVLLGTGGCASLLPVAVAALGGEGGKAGGAAAGAGPFAGAPLAAQNGRPADPGIGDALATVDDRVSAICKAQLPAEEIEIAHGCRTRPVCLAGAQRPMLLRVCAAASADLTAGLKQPAAGWRWGGEE